MKKGFLIATIGLHCESHYLALLCACVGLVLIFKSK